MSALLSLLEERFRRNPGATVIETGKDTWSLADLWNCSEEFQNRFHQNVCRVVAILLDNCPPWVAADISAIRTDITLVPLPPYFSDQQLSHALCSASVDSVITGSPEIGERLAALAGQPVLRHQSMVCGSDRICLSRFNLETEPSRPPGRKISFTSGTTGRPKGAILDHDHLVEVAESVIRRISAGPDDRHLCVFPLAQLLENVAGVYASLLSGAIICLPRLQAVGWQGSVGFDIDRLAQRIKVHRATTTISAPQILKDAVESGSFRSAADSLRLVAVGGAPVSMDMLQRARQLGIPALQGYGFTEAGSVVCLNPPQADRCGSVGLPLSKAEISISGSSEIIIMNRGFKGYIGAGDSPPPVSWRSGDTGHFDADGYLYINGRLKTTYCTSYGRNVSPEWVEAELLAEPGVSQAAVFGEGQARNVALIYIGGSSIDAGRVRRSVNARLPDYARIGKLIKLNYPFTRSNGLLRQSGDPHRDAIFEHYHAKITRSFMTGE